MEDLTPVAAIETVRGVCPSHRERHGYGIAAYFKSEHKVSLGFVKGLNIKIRVLQRRGICLHQNPDLHAQEYLI